jgi:hypothetical protein
MPDGKHMCVCEERRLSAHQENKEKEKLEKEPERETKDIESHVRGGARARIPYHTCVCM